MRTLQLLLWLGRGALVDALGPEEALRVRRDAPGLVPAIAAKLSPDSPPGARIFLLAACWLVAFHDALPGRPVADNAALFEACLRRAAQPLPGFVRRFYRWVFFLPAYGRRLTDGIFSKSVDGFEGTHLPGVAGRSFGVEYTACGIQRFLRRIGRAEVGPHVCRLDFVESDVFGLGLRRTGTIGGGAPKCDFHWERPS
jgi:hypothetical protein